MASEKKGKEKADQLISFKVTKAVLAELQAYAATQQDDSGLVLTPSLAARRLMKEGLVRIQTQKSPKKS